MIEILGPYYERPPTGFRERLERGQICEALIPYSGETSVRRLKVVATGDGNPWCEEETVDLSEIRAAPPVPDLNLKAGEALIVRQAKCRRVVVLSCPPASWQSGATTSESVYLVAPIYSFKAYDGEEHRSRVKACAYNTLFWMPGDDAHSMAEGCVRLDRVQPIHTALLDPKPVRLTPRALDAVVAWYGAFLTNRIPERIRTYRDQALKELEP